MDHDGPEGWEQEPDTGYDGDDAAAGAESGYDGDAHADAGYDGDAHAENGYDGDEQAGAENGYDGEDPADLDSPLDAGHTDAAGEPDPGAHDEPGFTLDGESHHGEDLGLSYSDYDGAEPDADPGADAHDATDPHFVDAHDESDAETADPVDGAHPDLDLVGDDPQWSGEDPFPPQLDGEPPEPVDGFPWSDPAVLGEAHDTGADAAPGSPPADDLLAYDAHDLPAGADPWQTLAGSEDPATSSLARWWSPGA